MTRLSAGDKLTIANNAVNQSAIRERRKAVDAKRKQWAENVRLWVNGDDEAVARDIGARIQVLLTNLPDGFRDNAAFLPFSSFKRVQFEGSRSVIIADWGVSRIVKNGPTAVNVPRDHALENEYSAIEKLDKDIKADVEKMREQVYSVVNSVTTVAKLLKVWPECKALLPNGLGAGKAHLPAIPIDDLNAALGLPKRPNPPGAE